MDNIAETGEKSIKSLQPSNLVPDIKQEIKNPQERFDYLYVKTFLNDYVGAGIYGIWETMQANQHEPFIQGAIPKEPIARATSGLQSLFDLNIGDGTIAALGFIGADSLLLTVDHVSRKFGKKGFDPKVRFLTSLTFGVGLASYLESTKFMGNTVDFNWGGDLFGIALGAAAILSYKVAVDKLKGLTPEKIEGYENKFKEKAKALTISLQQSSKLNSFSKKIAEKFSGSKPVDNPEVASLADEYTGIINETSNSET